MTPRIYDTSIASDGMTLDSPHGPVDLVAVERVQEGHYARLTRADDVHLSGLLTGSFEEAAIVGEALGIGMRSVLRRMNRARKRTSVP